MMRKTLIVAGLVAWFGCKRSPEPITSAAGEGAEAKQDVPCGQQVCTGGQVCCNPSCGICAPPEGMCTQQFCDAPPQPDGAVDPLAHTSLTCDNVRCAGGTHCELVEVQCIKAPCPPVPECKPDEPKSD